MLWLCNRWPEMIIASIRCYNKVQNFAGLHNHHILSITKAILTPLARSTSWWKLQSIYSTSQAWAASAHSPVDGHLRSRFSIHMQILRVDTMPEGRPTKAYDVTFQRYCNSHAAIEGSKLHIMRCMGSKFCLKLQRCPLKFHTKFWTYTQENMHFTWC